MKGSIIAITIAAAVAPVLGALNIAELPPCVLTCALSSSKSTTCAITDTTCLCASASYLSELQACASKACAPADLVKAEAMAGELCPAPSMTPSTTAPSTSSAETSSAETSTPSEVSSAASSSSAETAAAAYTTPSSSSSSSTTPVAHGTGASNVVSGPTGTSSPISYAGAADALHAGQMMGLLALMGLVAL